MNKSILIVIIAILIAGNACQQKIDVEKEQAAIKSVLEKSSKAWLDRDFEGIASVWVQDESATRIGAMRGSFGITEGWDSQVSRYETFFKNNPEPSQNKEIFSNYRMKVYKESAWVILDNSVVNNEGETLSRALHTYILEKVNDQWKIAALSTVGVASYENVERNLNTSATYHKFNLDDIDMILTDDFIGHNEQSRFTWTKENHKNYWSTNRMEAKDTVYYQVADGNWVATLFERSMKMNGRDVKGEAMHFKRFENGKIVEIYEFGDSRQWE